MLTERRDLRNKYHDTTILNCITFSIIKMGRLCRILKDAELESGIWMHVIFGCYSEDSYVRIIDEMGNIS